MTQDQDNITTMFEATNKVLDLHKPLWQAIPAFLDAVTRAESGTAAIREKSGHQGPTGDTAGKTAARDTLEEITLFVADPLAALAAKIHDYDLAAKVDLTKSRIDRLSGSDLVLTAGRVGTAAAAHSAVLASDYLVTGADLQALGDATRAFDALKTAPRDATVNRKVATLALPEAIAFVRGIYRHELDRLMIRFRKTQTDFYAAYFGARIIVDRPGTHKAKAAAPTVPHA